MQRNAVKKQSKPEKKDAARKRDERKNTKKKKKPMNIPKKKTQRMKMRNQTNNNRIRTYKCLQAVKKWKIIQIAMIMLISR